MQFCFFYQKRLLCSTLKILQLSVYIDFPCLSRGGFLLSYSDISLMGASSVRGARLVLTQIFAVLMKRFHHARRDWRGSLSNVLLPVLFVALAMALFSVKPLAIEYPSLKLTPRLYDNAESFFR